MEKILIMVIKTYKPYTPARRFMTGYDFSDLTQKRPEKKLVKFIKKTAGRNSQGRVTTRFKGGGHKRLYRLVDFRGYDKVGVKAKVASVEYDPYRTCRLALLNFFDGDKKYVLAWKGIIVGEEVVCGAEGPLKSGNRKQLKDIPEGVNIFNLEVVPNTKGKLVRTAGSLATIVGKDDALKIVFVKLQSGEVRKFNESCWATMGELGNEQHKNIVLGKAGRTRWKGRKGKVLGKSMNPVDHPHGGGEGHTSIGSKKGPKTQSGRLVAPGIKTRKKKKWSDSFIVSKRTK